MKKDNQRFSDPTTARAYIRNLADQFEEPEGMLEFLGACDMAQAALACWMFERNRFDRMLRSQYKRGVHAERESIVELDDACNAYTQASASFQLAKEKLKTVICKLDMAAGDRALTKNENSK